MKNSTNKISAFKFNESSQYKQLLLRQLKELSFYKNFKEENFELNKNQYFIQKKIITKPTLKHMFTL